MIGAACSLAMTAVGAATTSSRTKAANFSSELDRRYSGMGLPTVRSTGPAYEFGEREIVCVRCMLGTLPWPILTAALLLE